MIAQMVKSQLNTVQYIQESQPQTHINNRTRNIQIWNKIIKKTKERMESASSGKHRLLEL